MFWINSDARAVTLVLHLRNFNTFDFQGFSALPFVSLFMCSESCNNIPAGFRECLAEILRHSVFRLAVEHFEGNSWNLAGTFSTILYMYSKIHLVMYTALRLNRSNVKRRERITRGIE